MPRCRPMAETRTPIPLWREDLSGIRQFMAARPLNADTIVYISYTASIQEVDVEEAGVAYLVALRTGKGDPDAGDLKVIFRGQPQSAQGDVNFSGFYALQPELTTAAEITFRRLDTFDIVSSRRYCLGGHIPAPHFGQGIQLSGQGKFLPSCRRLNETRIPIPLWHPKLTGEGRLPSLPPTGDGRAVYISFDAPKKRCDNDPNTLLAFPVARRVSDRLGVDGLAVNFRGNNEPFDGGCRFDGLFLNEPVYGMHAGAIETYFGAIDKGRVASTGQYCLARPNTAAPAISRPRVTARAMMAR